MVHTWAVRTSLLSDDPCDYSCFVASHAIIVLIDFLSLAPRAEAKAILTLLQKFDSEDPKADDQLFFSQQLLLYLKGDLDIRISLDSNCDLFQPLSRVKQDTWSLLANPHRFRNELTGSEPVILHGNGPSKTTLLGLSNYIAGAYSNFYGTMSHVQVPEKDIDLYPLAVGLFFIGTPFEEDFIESIDALQIDKSKTKLYVYYGANSRVKIPEEIHQQYTSYHVLGDDEECRARASFLEKANRDGVKFALLVDSDIIINVDTVAKDLAAWNQTIVTSHAQREKLLWSNFWTDASSSGWYQRGFDTIKLLDHTRTGLFQVPFVRGLLLVRSDMLKTMGDLHEMNSGSKDICSVKVSHDALNSGVALFADNRQLYATMLGSEEFAKPDAPFPELYEAKMSPSLWAKHYLVADYQNQQVQEPCQDAYGFLLFTKRFCDELVATTEAKNHWSSGGHEDARLGSGYENYPTQDIHMNQFDFEDEWIYIMKEYIRPYILRVYDGVTIKGEINLAFVVRYSMDGQRELVPHNDNSLVTSTVQLNSNFTGGGVEFTRYNCSTVSKTPGYVLLHPGRVTHNHKAYPITSGTRYVLVSFNK